MTMEQNLEHRNNLLNEVLRLLEKYLDETGGCDHPVNICVCNIRQTLDEFGKDCYHRTGGAVGWQYLRFDVDTDDPKQLADEEASSAAEAMGNMRDIAMTMMQEMNDFRTRQLAIEADARNAAFRKGTIND
jgi:hypothetical protein